MPQPIDPLTEMGRATAAERVQQVMDRTAHVVQGRVADEAEKDTVRMQEQARQPDQKQAETEDEMRRRNPYMKIRKRKPEEEEAPPATYNAQQQRELPDDLSHGLDVTL